MIIGSYDDFIIQIEIKSDNKDRGEKILNVSSNNGDINIEFDSKKML